MWVQEESLTGTSIIASVNGSRRLTTYVDSGLILASSMQASLVKIVSMMSLSDFGLPLTMEIPFKYFVTIETVTTSRVYSSNGSCKMLSLLFGNLIRPNWSVLVTIGFSSAPLITI